MSFSGVPELKGSKIEILMYLVNLNEPDFGSKIGSDLPSDSRIQVIYGSGCYSGSFDNTRRKLKAGSEKIVY